jgi:hypothetical protein
MSADYRRLLDRVLRVFMDVEFKTEGRDVLDYSVVLLVEEDGQLETVRVYDGAHGGNELHRYTREDRKQPRRSSTTVPWVKVCVPRSRTSRADTRL